MGVNKSRIEATEERATETTRNETRRENTGKTVDGPAHMKLQTSKEEKQEGQEKKIVQTFPNIMTIFPQFQAYRCITRLQHEPYQNQVGENSQQIFHAARQLMLATVGCSSFYFYIFRSKVLALPAPTRSSINRPEAPLQSSLLQHRCTYTSQCCSLEVQIQIPRAVLPMSLSSNEHSFTFESSQGVGSACYSSVEAWGSLFPPSNQ